MSRDNIDYIGAKSNLAPIARLAVQLAEKAAREKTKALEKAQAEQRRLSTMPREIYKRDVTRESIVTAVTTTILMLVEFVLREYFGGLKMEYRTFIEHFVHTPTVVRSGPHRLLFQLESNPRNPKRTEQLRQACSEISRRKIKKGKQLLVFEVVDKTGQIP